MLMAAPEKCILNIPHKDWPLTAAEMEANYKELERWVRDIVEGGEDCMCVNCADSTNVSSEKCLLHIPHKEWLFDAVLNPDKEFENLDAIEKWATRFIQECGCTFVGAYC